MLAQFGSLQFIRLYVIFSMSDAIDFCHLPLAIYYDKSVISYKFVGRDNIFPVFKISTTSGIFCYWLMLIRKQKYSLLFTY